MKPPATLIPTPTRRSALACRLRHGQCFHVPLPPFPRDAAAWARFCQEINERIEAVRRVG